MAMAGAAPVFEGPTQDMINKIEYSEKYQDDSYEYRCVGWGHAGPRFRGGGRTQARRSTWVSPSPARGRLPMRLSCRTVLRCRHVILPKELAKLIPKGKLLSEPEWRAYGVQQSRGWEHYAIHKPEPHILLFRRLLGTDPVSGKVVPALRDAAVEAYHKEFEIGAGGAGTAAAGAAGKKA